MKIVSHGHHEDVVTYSHHFDYVGHDGWGFAFDCDASGDNLTKMCDAAKANYAACLTGEVSGRKVVDRGIVKRENTYYHPPVGLCDCGEELVLSRFTNACDCGRDYNSAGQELAPREQWGEETGETYADLQDL